MMSSSLKKTNIKNEEVCRTCLSKELDFRQSVFDVYLGSNSLDYIIGETTGIKIERGDGLPTNICRNCKERAVSAFEFKRKSEESDNTLRGLFKKEKHEYSIVEVPLYQTDTGVKTEQFTHADDDNDFGDSDFMPNQEDDLDFLKKEHHDADGKSGAFSGTGAVTSTKIEGKNKKCIKIEFEDSLSTYCPLCGTSYDGTDNLTKHMWTYHAELMGPKKRGRPKKLVTSSIINKLTENGFHLKPVPAKRFDCVFCRLQCKTKDDLQNHMKKHRGTRVCCCILCKKMFLKKKNFEQHVCLNKNEKSDMDEKTTDSNFLTEIMLHELLDPSCDVENMNILQVCNLCTGVFLSEEDIANHNDAEHPERSLRCNVCPKTFSSVKTAARHRSMCNQTDRKHICNTCGLKFAYEISLNKHILKHHEGQSVSVTFMDTAKPSSDTKQDEQLYQCDTCNRCFPKKESLAKHAKTHMPVEKEFECDICKKKFSRKDNLRSHKRIHEPNREKPPNNCLCLYCGRGFSNSSNLIVHMRRHTGEKPYKCDFCGKGFPRSSDLQCHRRSHTGEKPCICRVCGKGFSRSNKLSRHMRVHTGLKPYKCTYCEKAFSQSNDLTLHIRRHTGDKPYICEVCGDRFIQGTALQNHRRVHGHFPPSVSDAHPPGLGIPFTIQNTTQSH